MRQRCRISHVTGASNWYWLTVGQGLLSLQQERVEGECFNFFCCFIHSFFFLLYPSLSSPLLSLLSFLSLSLGDDTKWPIRVGVSLNPNTISRPWQVLWIRSLKNLQYVVDNKMTLALGIKSLNMSYHGARFKLHELFFFIYCNKKYPNIIFYITRKMNLHNIMYLLLNFIHLLKNVSWHKLLICILPYILCEIDIY